MTSFTSLTETRAIHVLCTFGKSFCSAADITSDSGYVVRVKVTVSLLQCYTDEYSSLSDWRVAGLNPITVDIYYKQKCFNML